MKTTYSTITLRYIHDVVTGEFVNIGVVLYAPEQRFLDARFTTSYERLNAAFLKIDHLHFRALMRYMANRFEELGGEVRDGLIPPAGLSELVKQVLPRMTVRCNGRKRAAVSQMSRRRHWPTCTSVSSSATWRALNR